MLKHDAVTVDENGYICFADERLDHSQAIALAYRLTQAVEDAIWRSQKDQPWFYDSEAILRRMNDPLGKAKSALAGVYGYRAEQAEAMRAVAEGKWEEA